MYVLVLWFFLIKIFVLCIWLIIVRGTLPRYRIDKVLRYVWKYWVYIWYCYLGINSVLLILAF